MAVDLGILSNSFFVPAGKVIHAGASLCQERDEYLAAGFAPVIWLEALTSVSELGAANLLNYPGQSIHNVTLWSQSDQKKVIYESSNEGQSSSLLKMKWHKFVHSSVIEIGAETHLTTTLDDFLHSNDFFGPISLLVLDLQGVELQVLEGAQETLGMATAVVVEVALIEMYESQPLAANIHEFMSAHGFILVHHNLVSSSTMGDALYVSQIHAQRFDLSEIEFPRATKHAFLVMKKLREDLHRLGVPMKLMKRPFKKS
jgi:FkbM family methyltransferase